jgi:predicted transcriptional regulator
MNVSQLAEQLGYTAVCMPPDAPEVTGAFTSDLLSDVMANAREQSILITIQAHRNSIAVASLAGLAAVLICSGREIPDGMRNAAAEHGIAVLSGKDDQFTASWRIGALLYGLPENRR